MRTATGGSSLTACAAFEEVAVFAFKDAQAGVGKLAPGHDDDVEPVDFVPTENLSYESFSPVPSDGAANLLRRRDPEPARRLPVRQNEQRTVAAMDPGSLIVNPLELAVAADSLGWAETCRSHP